MTKLPSFTSTTNHQGEPRGRFFPRKALEDIFFFAPPCIAQCRRMRQGKLSLHQTIFCFGFSLLSILQNDETNSIKNGQLKVKPMLIQTYQAQQSEILHTQKISCVFSLEATLSCSTLCMLT
jgi:hypothetical protein